MQTKNVETWNSSDKFFFYKILNFYCEFFDNV